MEPLMQEPPDFLSNEDRRAIRRWRWRSIGIYGCLLAGFVAYIAFSQPRDASHAAADARASISR
jgi:hypothetical protein